MSFNELFNRTRRIAVLAQTRISTRVGEKIRSDMIAEEAAELSAAACKYSRVLRGKNPTPVTKEEAIKALEEEFADVLLSYMVCFPDTNPEGILNMIENKLDRWDHRLEETIIDGKRKEGKREQT